MPKSIEIKCGSNTFSLEIEVERGDESKEIAESPTTVGELRDAIIQKAGLNPKTLKLIHKGKFIGMVMDEPLSNYNFSSGDKVMALGVKRVEDPGFLALVSFEKKNITSFSSLFNKLSEDIAEIEKNFLEGDIRDQALSKLEKRLGHFNEIGTQHMEAIDSLNIINCDTTEEQKQRNREKRKQMIEHIDNLLNTNEKNAFRLKQYRFKVEQPDNSH